MMRADQKCQQQTDNGTCDRMATTAVTTLGLPEGHELRMFACWQHLAPMARGFTPDQHLDLYILPKR